MPFPWQPAIHRGVQYALDHLAPFDRIIDCNGTDRHVQVRIGYHCFTEGRPQGSTERRIIDQNHLDEDRVFSPERWFLSWRLVKMLRTASRERFMDAGGAQWQHNMAIQGIGSPYAVFLKISPPLGANAMILNINSAYIKANAQTRAPETRLDVLLNRAAASGKTPGR